MTYNTESKERVVFQDEFAYLVTYARYHKNLRIVSDYGTAQKPKFNI